MLELLRPYLECRDENVQSGALVARRTACHLGRAARVGDGHRGEPLLCRCQLLPQCIHFRRFVAGVGRTLGGAVGLASLIRTAARTAPLTERVGYEYIELPTLGVPRSFLTAASSLPPAAARAWHTHVQRAAACQSDSVHPFALAARARTVRDRHCVHA